MRVEKAVLVAHSILTEYVQPGDVAIDATAGRGHDTVFLAKLVGETGRVYAFDIQDEAIHSTAERLNATKVTTSVVLHNSDHSQMKRVIAREDVGRISGIAFNLGYLPGSLKDITTTETSTIAALTAGLELIRPGGIITLVIYTGHDAGCREAESIHRYTIDLPQEHFSAYLYQPMNQMNNPPHLIAIRKHGE